VTPYLTALRARLKREAAPWRPIPGCEKLAVGREAAKFAGNDRDLADAITRLEAACGVTN
jgi:hypothetical protein